MLKVLKRGPASVKFSSPLVSFNSQCLRLVHPRADRRLAPPLSYSLTSRSIQTTSTWRQNAVASAAQEEVDAEEPGDRQFADGPITRFEDLGTQAVVSQTVVDTITKDMGLETMTDVQSQTMNESLKGTDMCVTWRNGKKKTNSY